jgi:uncharacterized protein with HEPN domain
MPKSDRARLQHILEAARKALELSAGRTRADMNTDEALRFALIHLLELVGEAATGVSSELRQAEPTIPWAKVIALRNRLIHGYFDVDLDIVWDTIQTRLPDLIEAVEAVVVRTE